MYDKEVMDYIYESIGIKKERESYTVLDEGKIGRIFMGLKIHPHQNLDVTLKKHEYPGFINFIKKQKDIEDLNYIARDINTGINTIKKIIEKMENDKDTKYSSKGITVKDCQLTIEWFQNVAKKAVSNRKKELKNK
jgi:hypothetical protein